MTYMPIVQEVLSSLTKNVIEETKKDKIAYMSNQLLKLCQYSDFCLCIWKISINNKGKVIIMIIQLKALFVFVKLSIKKDWE